ncbi:hypothetical protein INT44_001359 [Umbelopsis vinacea]|uniref:Aminotransferase class V domain-containing protein n=1 Tax=Umbelopsis vinacea TaxID=44442 RepID=A0A8H7URU5_9FUNG|nr:hypothetical protein INT44_001359 [Umbelopsis vinacea]
MLAISNKHAKKQFGHSLRADFLIAEDYTLMNHGSYGTYPAAVRTALRKYQDRAENCIDTWFRRDMYTEVQKAKEKLADLIHCNADDLAFIANASTGINSVARSLPFQPGDKILQLSTIFGATGATMRFVRDTRGVELVILDPTYPISDDDLVTMIEEAILKEETNAGVTGGKIKMAVFDTISSMPGVRVPYERIIKLLRKHNILSLVDGAHGIAKRNQRYIHPAITSEHYQDHSDLSDMSETFHKEFSWQGTQDFSGFLTTFAALEYRESLGGEEKIQEYCGDLARRGGELVAKILNTEVMENEEKTLTALMVNVRLPLVAHENDGYYMERFLEEGAFKRKCFAPGYKYKGAWYTRLSAQVYMEESDFEKAAYVLKAICEQLEQERLEGEKK